MSASPARTGAGQGKLARSYPGRIGHVAKLSVSLPDDLVQDLRAVARDNVAACDTGTTSIPATPSTPW